jgi:hypothetical protein
LCLQKTWLNPWCVIRLARDKLLPGKGKQLGIDLCAFMRA